MNLFKTKPEETLFANNTVIEHGMVVEAISLSGSCGLIVRGILKAAVDVDADVVIDSSGSVEGDITCGNCTVKGRVDGNVSASGYLCVTDEGSIFGDILCGTLQINSGGNFSGSCNMAGKAGQMNVYDIFGQKEEYETEDELRRLEAADGN